MPRSRRVQSSRQGRKITLRDLLERFSYARSKRGQSACGNYLPDLEQPRPPDEPSGMVKLRLVNNE